MLCSRCPLLAPFISFPFLLFLLFLYSSLYPSTATLSPVSPPSPEVPRFEHRSSTPRHTCKHYKTDPSRIPSPLLAFFLLLASIDQFTQLQHFLPRQHHTLQCIPQPIYQYILPTPKIPCTSPHHEQHTTALPRVLPSQLFRLHHYHRYRSISHSRPRSRSIGPLPLRVRIRSIPQRPTP